MRDLHSDPEYCCITGVKSSTRELLIFAATEEKYDVQKIEFLNMSSF